MITFATVPACLLGGFLGEYLGRKMTCFLVVPLFMLSFICTALAPDKYLLYFGRVLGGLALGLGSPPAGVYVTEIATPEWRTTFGGGLSAFYMVGMVLIFIVGKVNTLSMNIYFYQCIAMDTPRQFLGEPWLGFVASSHAPASFSSSSFQSHHHGWSLKVQSLNISHDPKLYQADLLRLKSHYNG